MKNNMLNKFLVAVFSLTTLSFANGQGRGNGEFEPDMFVSEWKNKKDCDTRVQRNDSTIHFALNKNTGEFYPTQVTKYTYDKNDNIVQILVIGLPERNNRYKQIFVYNTDNNLIEYTNHLWVDGKWEKSLILEKFYNEQGQITSEAFSNKNSSGEFQQYIRHFYNYEGDRIINYLRQVKNANGEWYDFSYHNYIYDAFGRLTILYGQYINGLVFWERTSVFDEMENRLDQRYLRQLKYDPVQKKNVLANFVFEIYTYNIFGNVAEIWYHSWINSQWEFTEKAILYYSLIPNKKVNICHNGQQICVSTNAVQAHLEHGDKLGDCTESKTKKSGNNPDRNVNQTDDVKFNIFPNPAKNQITIRFEDTDAQYTHGVILSSTGVVVAQFTKLNGRQFEYDVSKLMIGYYYVRMYREDGQAETRTLIKK